MSNKPKVKISPSILSANLLSLAADLATVEKAGADWHHIDVMDSHFVPQLTFGIPLIQQLKKISRLPLDVHIMVSNPDETALSYVEAGADILCFHVEAARHPHRILQAIKNKGAKAGVAINPGSPICLVEPLLDLADVVLVMSVNPGYAGQDFIPETVERVEALSKMLNKKGREDDVIIEVDGGINAKTAREVVEKGASALVAGSYIYGSADRSQAIRSLQQVHG